MYLEMIGLGFVIVDINDVLIEFNEVGSVLEGVEGKVVVIFVWIEI